MFLSACRRLVNANCFSCLMWIQFHKSLIIHPGTWGSDQLQSGEYNPPISFARLTQNVRWPPSHHPGLTFIYIISHDDGTMFYEKWKVRGWCHLAEWRTHLVEMSPQQHPDAFKSVCPPPILPGLNNWQDRADKGKLRQMRQRRLADKEIGQRRASCWMNVGRKMNGLIDRSLHTANKDRWRERRSMKRKCLSWHTGARLRLSTITLMNRHMLFMVCGVFTSTPLPPSHCFATFLHLFHIAQQVAALRKEKKTESKHAAASVVKE